MLQVITGRLISLGELNRALAKERDERSDVQRCVVSTSAAIVAALSLERRLSFVHRLSANCYVTPAQAQALVLLVNEIIVNAVKHAHPTGLPVTMTMACSRVPDGRMEIEIGDDGVGLPEGFDPVRDAGVGFKVIRSLADCLGAELEIESDSLGLTFRFLLPAAAEAPAIDQAPDRAAV